jgi:hypothetical protein
MGARFLLIREDGFGGQRGLDKLLPGDVYTFHMPMFLCMNQIKGSRGGTWNV